MVIAIQFTQQEITYFDVDEMNTRNENRQNPALNGLYDLKAAMELLPEKPKPIIVPFEGHKEFPTPYKPINGSMGSYLGVYRLDSDPLMAEYVDACRPSIERAALALDKPHVLLPYAQRLGWIVYDESEHSNVHLIYRPMYAAARMDFLQNNNPKRGAAVLLLLLKLQQKAEYDLAERSGQNMRNTLGLIEKLIVHAGSPENLDHIVDVLNQTKDSIEDPTAPMSKWFNLLDNTNHYATTTKAKSRGLSWKERFLFWQHNRASNLILLNKEVLTEMSGLPSSEHLDHFITNHEGKAVLNKKSNFPNIVPFGFTKKMLLYESITRLANIKTNQAHYAKLPIMIALQRYRNEHGAYPENMDQLVPEYLKKVPISPSSNTPFRYQETETGYLITDSGYERIQWDNSIEPPREYRYVREELFDVWPPIEDPVTPMEMPNQ
jgi:hypothetical protein